MEIFLHVLWNNVLPLSILIGIGIVMQRIFRLDIRTLSKMNFYLFSPALMFDLLYTTSISGKLFGSVLLYFALFMVAQYMLVEIVGRLRGSDGARRAAMRNAVLFYNSANYGIPINQLAFSNNVYTQSIQIIIMMMQSLIPNTYGIYSVNAHKANWRQIRKVILSMPIIYVIPLALILHGFETPIPSFIETSVGYLSSAFIGTALFTLGVQLGSMSGGFNRKMAVDVGIATILRLVAGPLLAWGAIFVLRFFMNIDDLTAAALIVSSAVPTSLSSVLLAVEFDSEQDFASQTVLATTTASLITVTTVIYFLPI
ncbi:AEC family transporter [Cohnella thailandensis]|uniref:AEC family transporter n=1 Tax=Cohnella thailandensis TaxID=557557 RepID=A0A841T2K5_9BACL|nr:AEC family transporter [Cohnella thailandensis]